MYVSRALPAPLASATCVVDSVRGGLPAVISARETSTSSCAPGSISISTIMQSCVSFSSLSSGAERFESLADAVDVVESLAGAVDVNS
jgi:hypothetical protein